MAEPGGRERGSASLEGVAVLALAGLLVLALAPMWSGGLGPGLAGKLDSIVCAVRTLAPCASGAAVHTTAAAADTGAPPSSQADTGGRRDQERGTAGDRGRRGSGGGVDQSGTSGQGTGHDPLGPPQPGAGVPEPQPPPWKPGDKGAGAYDSETAWPWDHAEKLVIETAANALSGTWPDASRNLLHYLANNGKPLDQDVNRILADVPGLASEVGETRTALGEDAVERAKAAGATGPVTFPVSTSWAPYYISDKENANWFYALGGISYDQTGQVTVYPPTTPGGPWRYSVSTRVNIRDQYNWDKGKETNIGPIPIPVPDTELAKLHRKGLAEEYLNTGTSDVTTTTGQVP